MVIALLGASIKERKDAGWGTLEQSLLMLLFKYLEGDWSLIELVQRCSS
jgi:hypothetical protein